MSLELLVYQQYYHFWKTDSSTLQQEKKNGYLKTIKANFVDNRTSCLWSYHQHKMKIEADKIRKLSCWHTGAQSGSGQGDMECLSVLRRKPTHRCTVRVMECLSVLRRKPTHRCIVRVRSG